MIIIITNNNNFFFFFFFQLLSLSLPNHWIKHLFLAHMYSELQHTDDALKIYQSFVNNGFANCTYIQAQIAIAHDNSRSTYKTFSILFSHNQ